MSVKALPVRRHFSKESVHPYDEISWSKRLIQQTNWKTGEIIFEQEAEFPDSWSTNAGVIVATKYFRGAMGTPQRENSLKQLIDRVVHQYQKTGLEHGYFADAEAAQVFADDLTWLLVNQYFSFNSPVWFNVGTNSKGSVSACFILAVEDDMRSILNWYVEEGLIFKGGSGSGVNLSKIRSSKELLSSGGNASGPVSFMRGADASAGTIKSGGSTRRSAKMVVLDVDHPDIEEFITTKVREEAKIRALRDAGFDMDLGGKDLTSVQYQNANNSVRVNDNFMLAVEANESFALTARGDGRVIDTVNAKDLFRQMAAAAWECADPGIQYDDAIQNWHTHANSGRIEASNPCSEHLAINDSSCNLASLNLMKFRTKNGDFDHVKFTQAVETVFTAMDISICFSNYPTKKIGQNSRDFRHLGIGYANLGALLMSMGLAYDSPEGRGLAASITSLLTGVAYRRSAQMASVVGAYAKYELNREPHTRVMGQHYTAAVTLANDLDPLAHVDGNALRVAQAAAKEWAESIRMGAKYGWRNTEASVLAPAGTIGFMMDCDTTGIEPDFSLVKFKKMVGGSSMHIVNNQVGSALAAHGFAPEQIKDVETYVLEHGNVVGAPHLNPDLYPVFDCAVGDRAISTLGHIHMMAAVQPFLSGAISKTVNMSADATVEDVEDVYLAGWKLGLKALAIYRDGSKTGQPLSAGKAASRNEPIGETTVEHVPLRQRLPRERDSKTTSFSIGQIEGYLQVGLYPGEDEHGLRRPGELFLRVSKQGSTLNGIVEGLAIAVSVGLQYGVPLETFVSKYVNYRFEPEGLTNDPDVRMAQSVLDYVFRKLAIDYLPAEVRQAYGIYTIAERTAHVNGDDSGQQETPVVVAHGGTSPAKLKVDAPMCQTCWTDKFMQRSGSCWACSACGSTSGCS